MELLISHQEDDVAKLSEVVNIAEVTRAALAR
jgi:hypothetical protein